jgi:hypothetical protein
MREVVWPVFNCLFLCSAGARKLRTIVAHLGQRRKEVHVRQFGGTLSKTCREMPMIFGLSVESFTLLHVIISLVGIASGIVVAIALVTGRFLPGMTAIFLCTTLLTSITGFFFPIKAIGPPHIVGAISLLVLAPTLYAIFAKRLAGSWRVVYKIDVFNALAPTQKEPPFLIAQLLTLAFFILLGVLALKRFHVRPS